MNNIMPQADSYADPISFGSILTFLRSCSFLSDKLRKPAIHFSGPIYKSPREVPSSRIRFYRVYRGITRVLPRVHTRTKNNNNLPRVLEMAYFWSSFFWIRQVDRRVFVFSTSRERWSNFGKRTAGSVALRAKNEQKLA